MVWLALEPDCWVLFAVVCSAEAAAAVNSVKPAKVDFKRTVLRSGPHFPR